MSNISKLPKEVKEWLCELVKQDGVAGLGDALMPYGNEGKMGGEIIVWFHEHYMFENDSCRYLMGNIYGYFEDNGWIPEESYRTIITPSEYKLKDEDFEDYPDLVELSVEEAIKELNL